MKRGLSLVEVIMAISLVGLIIIFLFGLLPSSALMNRQAENQTQVTNFAEELMNRLGTSSFETLKKSVGILNPEKPGFLGPELSERVLPDHSVMTPEIILELVEPKNRLIQATINIRWSIKGREKVHRVVNRYSALNR